MKLWNQHVAKSGPEAFVVETPAVAGAIEIILTPAGRLRIESA